jgi:hypothetical protein
MILHGLFSSCCRLRCVRLLADQEGYALLPKRRAHLFEVHEVGTAVDFHVSALGGAGESIEKPAGVGIGAKPIPGAADDSHRARAAEKRLTEITVSTANATAKGLKNRIFSPGQGRRGSWMP